MSLGLFFILQIRTRDFGKAPAQPELKHSDARILTASIRQEGFLTENITAPVTDPSDTTVTPPPPSGTLNIPEREGAVKKGFKNKSADFFSTHIQSAQGKTCLNQATTIPTDKKPVVLPFPELAEPYPVSLRKTKDEAEDETPINEKPILGHLRQTASEAFNDPVTDKRLVLKGFFEWKEDYFSQADVDFISECLAFDPSKHFDHPSDRLAHCRDLIHGYSSSPVKIEILIWMTRFADKNELFTDANNFLRAINAMLKTFLENENLNLLERYDFGLKVQELLLDDIRETQSDPTFESERLFSILNTLSKSCDDLGLVQKKAKCLLRFCKKVSFERFNTRSQNDEINRNKQHLNDLINKLETFQRMVVFSRTINKDDKI